MTKIHPHEFLISSAAGTASIALPYMGSGCARQAAIGGLKTASRRPKQNDEGPNPISFKVVVITDSHVRLETADPQNIYPSDNLANAKNRYAVKRINELNPDLVIHLGDITHTIPDADYHEKVMRNALETYKKRLKSPFHIAPGNHDIGDKPHAFAASPTVDEKSHEVFERVFGDTYSSFDFKGCHFVLLSSPVFNSGLAIEKKQRLWLEDDIKKSSERGDRIFLCMHFPLFLNNPKEVEHYDNIGEPSRSWLLSLIDKYKIEAVFSGHSHNFFYNVYNHTDMYILPSITFVRPDFTTMFHVGPAEEYGRADVNKLGFAEVEVKERGHKFSIVRTFGLTDDRDYKGASNSVCLFKGEPAAAAIGVSLRQSWAKTVWMPFDSLDEFIRKPISNDYLLQALFELDIKKLRVPIGDLADRETLEHMRALTRLGFEFTVFSVGMPGDSTRRLLSENNRAAAYFEVVVPRLQLKDLKAPIESIKSAADISVYLSVIDLLSDQKSDPDFVFSHFPSHGFKLKEAALLNDCINKYGLKNLIDGFVFRVDSTMDVWASIKKTKDATAGLAKRAMVNLKMPRLNEGTAFTDDNAIARVVLEALAASMAACDVDVFLDTMADHDRGYYPRHGLVDGSYNPRPQYHGLCNLHRAVGAGSDVEVNIIKTEPVGEARAFEIRHPEFRCALVLPKTASKTAVLAFENDFKRDSDSFQNRTVKKYNLCKGLIENIDVFWASKNSLSITPTTNEPFLLILYTEGACSGSGLPLT